MDLSVCLTPPFDTSLFVMLKTASDSLLGAFYDSNCDELLTVFCLKGAK